MRELSMLRDSISWIGLAAIALSLTGAFVAYFISTPDIHSGVMIDGFGRDLYPAPSWIRTLFQSDRWPGLAWWLFDMTLFGLSFVGGIALLAYASERNQH